jgi:N6-adenosine-specific RNA methylase IME4
MSETIDNEDETNIVRYEFHPYANVFPLMHPESREFHDLIDSLKSDGMLVPVLLYRGKILDGRNRYSATLRDSTIELITEEFTGSDEEALRRSLALNNERRHLNESQRALAALRLSGIQSGMKLIEGQKWAAELFKISFNTVQRAHKIFSSTYNEKHILIEMIENDDLSIVAAEKIVTNLHPSQWEQAGLSGKKAAQWIKSIKRQEREIKFANQTVSENRNFEQSNEMVYGVIYIDPPWRFEVRSENGMDRNAENHYPTMTLNDIRGMTIPAAENCAMFMWVTVPHLNNGIEILEGWGFEYKSAYFWHKTKPGLGYWSANTMEILLLGVKGEVPAPSAELRMEQVIQAEQGRHSEKPEVFADGITKMFPNVAKYEMFNRGIRHKGDNWFYHGNEAGQIESATTETNGRKPRNGNGRKTKATEKKEESVEEDSPL